MMIISRTFSYMSNVLKSAIRVFSLRMRGAKIGKRVLLGKVCFETRPKNICIGDGVTINDNVYFGSLSALIIKDYVKIHQGVKVQIGRNNNASLTIGFNSWIGDNTIVNCARNIVIGNDVGIGAYSQLWTHGYFPSIADGYPYKYGDIIIENGAWLPPSCLVLPDVEIGEHAIIGAGSVITKNIPPRVFATGIPCKVLLDNEKQYRKILKADEKVNVVLEYCLEYMELQGINIKKEGNKTWRCSFYHKKFFLTYLENPMDWDYDKPACIFTWNPPGNGDTFSQKISLFILSNNTYTKRGSFHEWVIIRALLDTCALRLMPV